MGIGINIEADDEPRPFSHWLEEGEEPIQVDLRPFEIEYEVFFIQARRITARAKTFKCLAEDRGQALKEFTKYCKNHWLLDENVGIKLIK